MGKIDIIEDCIDCSKRMWIDGLITCGITNNMVNIHNIPFTCPLDDFTEPGVEADELTQCRFKDDACRLGPDYPCDVCRIYSPAA